MRRLICAFVVRIWHNRFSHDVAHSNTYCWTWDSSWVWHYNSQAGKGSLIWMQRLTLHVIQPVRQSVKHNDAQIALALTFSLHPLVKLFFHQKLRKPFLQMRTRNDPRYDKTNKMSVRPAKTQVSLGIHPVSESSLSAWRNLGPSATHWAQAKTLIRLGGCPGWSESSLGAHSFCWFCHVVAQIIIFALKWEIESTV